MNKLLLLVTIGVTVATATLAQQADSQWKASPSLISPVKVQQYYQHDAIPVTPSGLFPWGVITSETLGVEVTSIVDSVELQSITLNRGNCKLRDDDGKVYTHYNQSLGLKTSEELKSEGWKNFVEDRFIPDYKKPNLTLKFGEQKKFSTTCSDILEVVVKTNLGEFRFGGG
jgi:hypothetical protein